jgi:hypothetical protein
MVVAAHRPLQTHHYTRIQSLMEAPDPESRQLARHALWSSQSPRDAKIAQLATEWFSRETDLDTRFSLAVDLWALLPAELVVSSVAPLLAHENPCDRYQALRALARFPAPLATAIARLGVDDEPDVFLGAALRHYSR